MDLRTGVYVTLVGMGLVFATLAVIMVVTMALNRIFRPSKGSVGPVTVPGSTAMPEADETARVAAIAVALMLARAERDGSATLPPPGPRVLSIRRRPVGWKVAGRVRDLG